MQQLFDWNYLGSGVAILISLGVGMLQLSEFRAAKGCFSLSAILLWAKVFMWGVTTSLGFRYRAVVVSICFAAAGVLLVESFRWVEKKKLAASPRQPPETPLSITSRVTPYIYARGAGVGGVHFLPEFTDTRLFIENPGDTDYESADISLSTDMTIQGFGQVSSFPGIVFVTDTSPEFALLDKEGHINGVFPALGGPTSNVRVRCSTTPNRSRIELVLALATLTPWQGGKPPLRLFSSRRVPQWVRAKGTYRIGGQDRAMDSTVVPEVVSVQSASTPQAPASKPVPDTQSTLNNLVKTLTDALG